MIRFVLLSISFFLSITVNAANDLRVNGFATLAATHIEDDLMGFRSQLINKSREDSSLIPDSMFGLQANYIFNESFDVVVQGTLSDKSYEGLSNYIDMAFVRYRHDNNWSGRVGRLNSRLYMLSEYRNTGYAYLWARPPIELYSAVTGTAYIDGVELNYTDDFLEGQVSVSVGGGNSRFLLDGSEGVFELDYEEVMFFNIEYQSFSWRFNFTAATATMNNFGFAGFGEFIDAFNSVPSFIWPEANELADGFHPDGKRVNYFTVGAFYDDGEWLMQSEIADYEANWLNFPDARFGYLSFGKRFGSYTPYFMVAANRPKKPFRSVTVPNLQNLPPQLAAVISQLASISNDVIENVAVDQNSFGAGIRWDFTENWALKFQANRYTTKSPGSGLFGNNDPNLPSEERRFTVLHLGISTVF